MKRVTTWILIADGARARVLATHGPGQPLSEVEGSRREIAIAATHDLVDDRLGRSNVAGGARRHAYPAKSDPHREAKRQFLADTAAMLEARLAGQAFDRLVLVAPPQALGDLRASLSAAVAQRVAGEVAKDLTKTPDHEVAGHLQSVVGI